ncbi:hypothetical protein SAMN02745123_01973 [Desulforamulus aeronauticus DSM 10349]|uniref:Anionic cell wall polymer biosynthesis enzyme, LytR-Cps2A-Psr (LCP) family n=2 Tax=Desulforamulus aeronauticus TaxID=53343 RepID=A0A1M6SR36_9FIRM|nr:hypothetical protein SAMN02745123_01973 [Desulforamulus aeronauticus DSM 10349]
MKKVSNTLTLALFLLLLLLFPLPGETANLEQNKTNILCIWTDRDNLKAVTIMSIDSATGKIGILSVPIFAHLEGVGPQQATVELVWNREGRTGLTKRLESALRTRIDGHISFDQPVIERASNLIGAIELEGTQITILQAFEDTRLEKRKNDQDILRTMAATIVSPSGIKKIPRLLWIFTSEVNTDIRPDLMLGIYRAISHEGPTILTKKALRGKDYYRDGYRYRYVEPITWKNIMSELSA